jgi:hypothetical protein
MSLKSFGIVVAASLLLASPLNEAMAQRGGRGGGGGGGGGGWGQGNGGGGGGGGNSGSMSMRSSSRGDGGSSRSSFNGSSGRSQSRQSFYRGPDSNRSDRDRSSGDFNRGDRDRSGRDGDRGDRSRNDRDGDRGDRDRNSRDFDRDRDRNDRDFNRGDRDRGRDRDFADRMRRDWDGRGDRDRLFRWGWWDSYGLAGFPIYSPWRYSWWRDRPYYWWGWSSPRGLTNWLVYGFDRPLYWDYGYGGNIWYDNDYVYYDGRRTMNSNDYYGYLDDLCRDIPNIDKSEAEKMEWKPLGVFAVRRENDTNSDRAMQLAVNRDGVITGTYFIEKNKEARPLAGRVDERTQRATWRFTDTDKNEDDTIFETSVYNLTKPSTNVMVHFGPKASDAEVWQLVRMEQPASDSDTTGQSSQR